MFTNIRPNYVQSDEGFSVEIVGRSGIRYFEGNTEYFVNSELLVGPVWCSVVKNSIRYIMEVSGASTISDAKKNKIVDNIRKAFHHMGGEIHVVE